MQYVPDEPLPSVMRVGRVAPLLRRRAFVYFGVIAVLAVISGAAAAKCGGGERFWSLELLSLKCDRSGTDCGGEDTSLTEASHWQPDGKLGVSVAGDSVWIDARDDGTILGNLSAVSP